MTNPIYEALNPKPQESGFHKVSPVAYDIWKEGGEKELKRFADEAGVSFGTLRTYAFIYERTHKLKRFTSYPVVYLRKIAYMPQKKRNRLINKINKKGLDVEILMKLRNG